MSALIHYTFDVPRGQQRFRELIVYVCQKCAHDPTFGAVKLNKILYHVDFRAFERFGIPLTGVRYFRLPQGPAPRAMVPVMRELQNEGAIRTDPPQQVEFEQRKTVALRDAYLDHFTPDEIELIDEIVNELWGKSATAASEETHGVAWRTHNHKDDIPYEAAFLADLPPTADDISDARELNERWGWGLRV